MSEIARGEILLTPAEKTGVTEAAKTATDFIEETADIGDEGIIVHPAGDLDNYVHIKSDGVHIYVGGIERATFLSSEIGIGLNSSGEAVINLCNNMQMLEQEEVYDSGTRDAFSLGFEEFSRWENSSFLALARDRAIGNDETSAKIAATTPHYASGTLPIVDGVVEGFVRILAWERNKTKIEMQASEGAFLNGNRLLAGSDMYKQVWTMAAAAHGEFTITATEDFDFFIAKFQASTTDATAGTSILLPTGGQQRLEVHAGEYLYYRNISVSTNKRAITFYNGFRQNMSTGAVSAASTAYLIPLLVMGVKFS